MPGPAPKHPSRRARRNNPKAGFTSLPAAGRTGKVPPWPLGRDLEMSAALDHAEDSIAALTAGLEQCDDSRKRGGIKRKLDQAKARADLLRIKIEQAADAEEALWAELWVTPQAAMWDESSAFARMVAQFVRWNIRAEQGDLKAATEARLRGAELGLTPLSLLRLRREVEETEKAQAEGQKRRERRTEPEADKKKPEDPGDDPRTGLHLVS